ncbi:carboxylate-amine ligase [Microbacterium sp. MAHUQ-60]|uniref:carboxylate-amine ligase n=1 Tax=unclassified Microbacterium TaxID=2609290 RepID=UPI00360C34B8
MSRRRIGIEEEFVLLDSRTLAPLSAQELHDRVLGEVAGGGTLAREFATSQTEAATTPVLTLLQAGDQLRRSRRMLAAHARDDTLVAAIGAPFVLADAAEISRSPHYDDVSGLLGRLTTEHVVNGLHVHVEVDDDEARVRALLRVRERLPVLLALSANSPFAGGAPAGHASWRSTLIRRLPVSWGPPPFHDADEYHRTVDRLMQMGALPARSSVSWAVRLSDRYRTVETRVCDAQLSAEDSLVLAALTRAIVVTDDAVERPVAPEILDASLWLAARHGMDARLPSAHGDSESAWTAVQRMLDELAPALEELEDSAFVRAHLDRLRVEGTGSQRQLRAYETGGVPELARLLRRC